jgi:hypothetical protein
MFDIYTVTATLLLFVAVISALLMLAQAHRMLIEQVKKCASLEAENARLRDQLERLRQTGVPK